MAERLALRLAKVLEELEAKGKLQSAAEVLADSTNANGSQQSKPGM